MQLGHQQLNLSTQIVSINALLLLCCVGVADVMAGSQRVAGEGSDTLKISYASSEITFEIMKSHTQKKSEITLFKIVKLHLFP